MALNLNLRSPYLLFPPCNFTTHHKAMFLVLLRNNLHPFSCCCPTLSCLKPSSIVVSPQASTRTTQDDVENDQEQDDDDDDDGDELVLLDDDMISKASGLKDATQVLQVISDDTMNGFGGKEKVVSCGDCCRIISAALLSSNVELALSIYHAMRSSSFQQVLKENGGLASSWKWSRPDLNTYSTLVIGLAASLRVSDALKIVEDICRVGLSSGEEVPFGKVLKCPTCLIAIAVAQPQQGIQVRSSR